MKMSALDEEINRTKEILLINLNNFIPEFDEEHADCIAPPTKGIYFKGHLEPFILEQKGLYVITNGLKIKVQDNCLLFEKDIYYENGKLAICENAIINLKEYLTCNPSKTIQYRKIAIAVILEYLNSLNDYTKVMSNKYNLNYLIKPEGKQYLAKNVYQEYFKDLIFEISKFVGKDTWHIYNFKFEPPNSLIIEKLIDYRVKVWYDNNEIET